LYAHCENYFGNKQAHWMNPNKEYHDLNPDYSPATRDSILEGCLELVDWNTGLE